MRWVRDRTGRFAQRPHYEFAELDVECELTVTNFVRERHGAVTFPVATDDLIVLLERESKDLDIYADLTGEGPEVEGVTYFGITDKPVVKIARHLAEEAHAAHRFRTTATHELGHVKFHTFLWMTEGRPTSLFADTDAPRPTADTSPRCKRDSMQPMATVDWMEWQAGYACGAFLMPITHLRRVVADARGATTRGLPAPNVESDEGRRLITAVADAFDVSQQAARVRLLQAELVSTAKPQSTSLFAE
jgi:Zn-dependent peptidase ImmA (M78 family)